MVIHLQRTLTADDVGRLQSFLAQRRHERTEADVHWVRDRLVEQGSVDAVRATALDLADAALADLPDSVDKAFLLALPDYVVARSR